jgi:serine phosphatase RsbU (regulator of sigma subunit)
MLFNNALRRILPTGLYVTACYAKVLLAQLQMEIGVAAAPAPVLQRSDQMIKALDLTGDVMGPYEDATFDIVTLQLEKQDRVFFFTDGLIDNHHRGAGRCLSRSVATQCLCDALTQGRDLPLQDLVDGLVDERMARPESEHNDDIVLLAIEV